MQMDSNDSKGQEDGADQTEERHGIDPKLAPLEYHALAFIMRRLSRKAMDELVFGTRDEEGLSTEERIVVLRKTLSMGTGTGAPERVPHELLRNESNALLPAMEYLHKQSREDSTLCDRLTQIQIPQSLAGPLVKIDGIQRPCPVPVSKETDFVKLLRDDNARPRDLADQVTAWRFGCVGKETVRKAPSVKTRGKVKYRPDGERCRRHRAAEPDPAQDFLASVFLDYCSDTSARGGFKLRAIILDVLLNSGYDEYVVYYLVQLSHIIPRNVSLGLCSGEQIRSICKVLQERPQAIELSSIGNWFQCPHQQRWRV